MDANVKDVSSEVTLECQRQVFRGFNALRSKPAQLLHFLLLAMGTSYKKNPALLCIHAAAEEYESTLHKDSDIKMN